MVYVPAKSATKYKLLLNRSNQWTFSKSALELSRQNITKDDLVKVEHGRTSFGTLIYRISVIDREGTQLHELIHLVNNVYCISLRPSNVIGPITGILIPIDSIERIERANDKTERITCLGKIFDSEEDRRHYFREELRNKLPDLKKIEGFPIGEDDDIIALSDPPYYGGCPNPWLNDFISEWDELEKILGRDPHFKVTEPFTPDVIEGKNNPIYNVHTYHTKVPHPAIMRFILHYTQPGDIMWMDSAGLA